MSTLLRAADGADQHRLTVETDADPNLLLRLLEPFVIHAVLPTRIASSADHATLRVEIEFAAPAELAERLHMRLSAMVAVRSADLSAVRVRPAAAA